MSVPCGITVVGFIDRAGAGLPDRQGSGWDTPLDSVGFSYNRRHAFDIFQDNALKRNTFSNRHGICVQFR